MSKHKNFRIVITGGPGGGKTTALDIFRRELENVVTIPESASLLFSGGLPRSKDEKVLKTTQRTIYQLQLSMEEIYSTLRSKSIFLCDRGTIDGAAYWPGDLSDFCNNLGTTIQQEFERYDAVIFFETAAKYKIDMKSNNPCRIETEHEALILDQKLRELWSGHPSFHFVPGDDSFFKKITRGVETIKKVLAVH